MRPTGCPRRGLALGLGCVSIASEPARLPRLSRPALLAVFGLATALAALGLTLSLGSEGEPPAVAQPVPAAAPASTQEPGFDVIRVDEKGDAVLAGRAQPKAELILLDGDQELGRTNADDRGEWVLVPSLPLPPGARSLSLEVHLPDGQMVRAARPVLMVVPESAAQPPLAIAPAEDGGARLVLGPKGEAEPLTIDLADRDETGRLFVGGHAAPGALVQLYLDNGFLGRVRADSEGNWRLGMGGVGAKGLLRADMVDEKVRVRARVEVPLQPPANEREGVTVEPGSAQWTITHHAPGRAPAFTVIYGGGKDRQRDPDRVYPGQVTHLKN